jgi:GT2 family glycosyltransferase
MKGAKRAPSPSDVDGARIGSATAATARHQRFSLSEVLRQLLGSSGGLNRMAWQLGRDYLTILRAGVFDRAYYLNKNPDVAAAGMDPLLHFLRFGEAEGRRPGRNASIQPYLPFIEDWRGDGGSPLAAALRKRERGNSGPSRRPDNAGQSGPRKGVPRLAALPTVEYVEPALTKPLVVYTAIFDAYDALRQPSMLSDEVDFVCFSDVELRDPGVWQLRSLEYFHSSPRRMARYAKTHPHVLFPDHQWSLWIDGRVGLQCDPMELIRARAGDADVVTFRHPDRNDCYEEADEVIALDLDDPVVVKRQMALYRAAGLPPGIPLYETNVLLRRHNAAPVIALDQAWFAEMEVGSARDQLSLGYAAWRLGVPIDAFGPRSRNARADDRFAVFRHRTNYRSATGWLNRHTRSEVHPPCVVAKARSARTHPSMPVDIIVCVHDALEDVQKCLESVQGSRDGHERLIVVDDGSGEETAAWLRARIRRDDLLIRRPAAAGYTVAANTGLKASAAPLVVLLNSDTVVPAGWLDKLRRAVLSAPDIGIVGPMSNAASYQSLPRVTGDGGGFAVNALPPGYSVEDMDHLCGKIGAGLYPRVPVVNGFCMMIARAVIDRIGHFDEETFPQGYGEENDYCFRAWDAGFASAIACDSYIYHAKSRSYSKARRDQLAKAMSRALKSKWSDRRVEAAGETLVAHPWLARIRTEIAGATAEPVCSTAPRPSAA